MKIRLSLALAIYCLCACQNKKTGLVQTTTIDSTLQVNATSTLEHKLSEINALSGQIIIMEVQTGQIKALVGLERKDSADYQHCEDFAIQQPTGLMNPISVLAALETGKVKLDDIVDTGNGIYLVNGNEVKDHNWNRGGYGEITMKEGIAVNSNIATAKTMNKVFGNSSQSYFDMLNIMDYGKPDSIKGIDNLKPITKDTTSLAWFSIGHNQLIAPIQTLTFYNAIANNGKMVQPQLYKDSIIVINPQIASKTSIDSLKQALLFNITDGLGKPAYSNKVLVAGIQGTTSLTTNEDTTKNEYAAEFCGYFPADNPKYSIIVSINKAGLPVSGGLMASDVFRQITEYIINFK